jgi:nitronate monooxygenase
VILDRLRYPIVLAPLGGGPSTPALTAAVSNAGGLGFLAGGYLTASDLRAAIGAVRERTSAPFGVNVFVPGSPAVDERAVRAYLERLQAEAARYGASVGDPRYDDDDWDAKVALLRDEPVPVVSFTFAAPPADVVAQLRKKGSEVWATVTEVAEARVAHEAGVDVLVVQGVEAGAHRASFRDRDDAEALGVLPLIRLVSAELDLPLVAAGGIGDGASVAAVLVAGASAAQIGTGFLRAAEAGTHPVHRAALAADAPTALTRAFSGRLARGLVNRFLTEHSRDAPSAYPHVHFATAPIRAAAREQGEADGFNLWAGQAHRLARELPAAEIVETLAREARTALAAAEARLDRG